MVYKLSKVINGKRAHSLIFVFLGTRSILERILTWGNSSWIIAESDAMQPLMNLVTSVINWLNKY